jgi:ribonuclease BN (tRNA processing enzyme)
MQLTVLGLCGGYPCPGGATSGYLLQSEKTTLLLECGSGVLANLQKIISIDDVDAVFLSHLHGDHIADMQVLRYMIPMRKQAGVGTRERINVYCPPLPEQEYKLLRAGRPFDIIPVTEGMRTTIGDARITFMATVHPYPGFGIRVEANGKIFAFSGDTVLGPHLAPLAQDADVFLCDSATFHPDKTPQSVHMSAREAAETAARHGVKRLILTHFVPHGDRQAALSEALEVFPASELAEEMKTFEI